MAPNANENGEVGHSDEKDTDNLKDLNYPFQNIVLEGGGSKGLAYVGALEVSLIFVHFSFWSNEIKFNLKFEILMVSVWILIYL